MRNKKSKNQQESRFAKKSLGQNFLNNPNIRDHILLEAGDINDKNILEIGPGLGYLTQAILEKNANLTALEIDMRSIHILEEKWGENPNFTLLPVSILDIDLDEQFKEKKYSIIANIPYHITNPILKKILAETQNKPEFTIFMVQKEVAQKICNQKKRSILSISVEIFAETKYCFTVTRENFNPAPRVDSAIIRLDTRKTPLIDTKDEIDFFTIVNAGFSQKRKKIGNYIGKFFGTESTKILGTIDPSARAETLQIKDWIAMTKNFQKVKKNLAS